MRTTLALVFVLILSTLGFAGALNNPGRYPVVSNPGRYAVISNPIFSPNIVSQIIQWDAPTTRVDSSALSQSEIANYRVYYSQTLGSYSTYTTTSNSITSLNTDLLSLASGTWYFVGTAVDTNGQESSYSNTTSRVKVSIGILASSPSSTNFGNVTLNSSATQSFTISNIGTATAGLTSAITPTIAAGVFVLSGNTCGSTLATSATCTMGITFTPTAAVTSSATLTVAYDGLTPLTISAQGTGVSGGGATEYFGNYASTYNTFDSGAAYAIKNNNITYTCPGAGTRTLTGLHTWAKSVGGTPGHIRLALYDTSNNKICEGSAEVTVDSTTASWVGHTGMNCSITGGTNYRIAVSADSTDVQLGVETGHTTGDYINLGGGDYTGGFPTTFNTGSNSSYWRNLRATVQ